jgi:hypothetical protein
MDKILNPWLNFPYRRDKPANSSAHSFRIGASVTIKYPCRQRGPCSTVPRYSICSALLTMLSIMSLNMKAWKGSIEHQ